MTQQVDVIVIGAGAAGLMCAIEAAKRGRRTVVLDHAKQAGRKILMSGGGRCNFTNYYIEPDKYVSTNPHFCKSALSRYTQWDFIALVDKHQIPYHEKTLGQLFCDQSSKDIAQLLLTEARNAGAQLLLSTEIECLQPQQHGFHIVTSRGEFHCESCVIATGGLSIPTMGATPFGYRIAEQFGLKVLPTRAGLVPFTLQPELKQQWSALSGVSVDVSVTVSGQGIAFRENLLFTHRGLSGPAILQISSYWHAGEDIEINWLPDLSIDDFIQQQAQQGSQQQLKTLLAPFLTKRVVDALLSEAETTLKPAQISHKHRAELVQRLHHFRVKPAGTEGYRTAEVTLGGIDTDELSSKTFEAKKAQGLYFIGEVVDVTGWLGGYNFQWAWSSGWCAGQFV